MSSTTLKRNLKEVTFSYERVLVRKDKPIRDYLESVTGRKYNPGTAYYELTKREEIQGYKDIIIEDRKDAKPWTGDGVRDILGIPNGGAIKVSPGDHAGHRIFIQSTSVNRKLVPNTTVLFAR